MAIKVMLAIPTLNQYPERLPAMLRSVASSTRIPDRVLIVDNGRAWHQQPYAAEFERSFELDVFTPVRNLGVAGSVNYAMRNTPRDWYWMHANDDVELDQRCIRLLTNVAEETASTPAPFGAKFLVPEHGVGSAFTVFLSLNLAGTVGYFDEVFNPSYHEDNSYGRRMNLAGVRRTVVTGAAYEHHTSSTLKAFTEEQKRRHHENFRRNAAEYVRMWGGPPENETFDIPYDGRFGHSSANRNNWAVHEAPSE